MWLDALAFLVLLVFSIVGGCRGSLDSGLRLLALGLSYVAAAVAARLWGRAAAEVLDLSLLLAAPLVGSLAFLACRLMIGLAGRKLRSIERDALAGEERQVHDRALGALFGAARGLVLVLLVGWMVSWVGALSELAGSPSAQALEESVLASLSGQMAGSAAQMLLEGDAAADRLAVRLVAEPAQTLDSLRSILEHPGLVGLQRDGAFWNDLQAGDVERALDRPSFVRVASDSGLRQQLAALGVVDFEAARDPESFREEMERVVAQMAPRLRGMREDPELQGLLEDPDVRRRLEAGDTLGLLAHPGFQRLMRRFASL